MTRTTTIRYAKLATAAATAAMLATGCEGLALPGDHDPGDHSSSDVPPDVAVVRSAVTTPYDWLQLYGDGSHAGNNTKESLITAQNVNTLTQLFHVTLPAEGGTATYTEGPAAILTGINAGGKVRDLAFVESRLGTLYALDAATGAIVWSAKPAPTSPTSNFTNTSPAVDPNRAFVYSYGFDGKVHKYAVATGVETTTGGWPEIATAKPDQEKAITSLTTATDSGGNTYLYVGHSGYGDGTDTEGHVTAINLATGAQKVFNAMCSTQAVHFGRNACAQKLGSIWGRAPMVYSPATNRIYGATGNGPFDPTNHAWGDTVLSLNADGSGNAAGNPVDTYTPASQGTMQSSDLDLGSASVALLPTTSTKYPHLGLQAGKDNTLRILNLDNLSNSTFGPGHVGGELYTLPLDTAHAQAATVSNSMPVWTNPADGSTWVFVAVQYELFAFKLLIDGSGNPSLGAMWGIPNLAYPGGSLIVANNVLYWAYSATQSGTGNVKALSPTTGATLWTSSAVGGIHWQSPVVANGVVYITDNAGGVTAFGLPSSNPLSRTGWTATASATGGADVPANALDGNLATRWSTGAPQANGQWFKVDMKSSFSINKLVLDANGSADYPRGYSVTLSADDVTYGAPVATGTGTSAVVTITFSPASARYVKITQTGSATSWWSIHELNVYGASGPPPLTAYARTGWVATAQNTNGADVVANALDGNSASRWSDGIPQSTMTNPAQYFQVDMGVSQPFSQITLDSAGSTGDYLRNYQVFAGTTNPPTTSIATGTATGALTTITFSSVTARYVRVVQTAASAGVGSWWSIAELNVWH
jgi:hypothetical protein